MHEKKYLRLTKICEKDRKDRMFPFHKNIIISELFFKRKWKKAASFYKCVFFRKYEIFVYDSWTQRWNCRNVTKTSDFLLAFRSTFRWQYWSKKMKFSVVLQRKQAIGELFVEDVYNFSIISCKKRHRRISDLFFSPLW